MLHARCVVLTTPPCMFFISCGGRGNSGAHERSALFVRLVVRRLSRLKQHHAMPPLFAEENRTSSRRSSPRSLTRSRRLSQVCTRPPAFSHPRRGSSPKHATATLPSLPRSSQSLHFLTPRRPDRQDDGNTYSGFESGAALRGRQKEAASVVRQRCSFSGRRRSPLGSYRQVLNAHHSKRKQTNRRGTRRRA